MTTEGGVDEFGIRRRVCRTFDTEGETRRLHAMLQHETYEGRHIQPSSESVAAFCQRFLTAAIESRPRPGAVPLSRQVDRVVSQPAEWAGWMRVA